ncbi:MAG: gamma carbonic anhydrase family protein [Gammaproteobacteria bacterium RIFCSPHIGHO2_12_FULL_35_23]|nr:MAG: gamma carbonic anhydrase family protein [Gammaproteobacteria bacterium RIFCSPHIGHO2_12_FULL_35_23]
MAIRQFAGITPIVPSSAFVDEMALVLGDVVLGEQCSVWSMTVIRGDVHRIRIGARTNIQDGSVLHVTHFGEYNGTGFPLIVGNDVTVGHGVVLHACTVGDRCLIGMHSTLLDGAIIENEVMIGAHSLVTPGKLLESGYLYCGSPVKKMRALTSQEIKFLQYSANHYVELKNKHQGK